MLNLRNLFKKNGLRCECCNAPLGKGIDYVTLYKKGEKIHYCGMCHDLRRDYALHKLRDNRAEE